MKQNTVRTRKLLAVAGIIAVLVTVGVVVYAFQPASTDGQLNVVAPTLGSAPTSGMLTARANLLASINNAKDSRDATDIEVSDPRQRPYWAPGTAHNDINAAIATAEEVLSRSGIYRRGDEFDVTVNMSTNPGGFVAMLLRLQLPAGLEVVKVTPGANFVHPSFQGGIEWNPDTFVLPRQGGTVYAGWAGREDANFTGIGTLMTFRLRVRNDAPLGNTAPILLSFGTAVAPHTDAPVRRAANTNTALNAMSIQGVTNPTGNNQVNLGVARIVN